MAPFRVNLENLVFDQYQRWLPRPYDFDHPVRIVDIDDESIRHIGRWPWPRQTMAELVEALTKAGAAAIAFDVLFSEKDNPSDEEKACLQRVIRTADQTARCQERADGDIAFGHAVEGRPVALGTFFTTTPNAVKTELPAKAVCLTSGTIPPSSSIASTERSSQSPYLPRPRGALDISTGCPTTTGSCAGCH